MRVSTSLPSFNDLRISTSSWCLPSARGVASIRTESQQDARFYLFRDRWTPRP